MRGLGFLWVQCRGCRLSVVLVKADRVWLGGGTEEVIVREKIYLKIKLSYVLCMWSFSTYIKKEV